MRNFTSAFRTPHDIQATNAGLEYEIAFKICLDLFLCDFILGYEATMIHVKTLKLSEKHFKYRRTHRRWIYSQVSACTVFFIAVTFDNQTECQKQSKLSQVAARSVAFYPMSWRQGCVSARVCSSL